MPTRRQRRGGFAISNPFSGLFGQDQEKKEVPGASPVSNVAASNVAASNSAYNVPYSVPAVGGRRSRRRSRRSRIRKRR